MAWLEAHDELLNHPKTAVLSASMGWNKFETVGRLLGFWWWCLKYAPTGDLRKHNDTVLGSSVELNGKDATGFVKAMVEACWLDRCDGVFRVHDWPEFTKRYLKDSKFNGRPDKWLEVMGIYKGHGALESTQEKLKSNSSTYLPTNQPTNNGRRSAEQKAKDTVLNALNGSK